jgi:hypothetical protein
MNIIKRILLAFVSLTALWMSASLHAQSLTMSFTPGNGSSLPVGGTYSENGILLKSFSYFNSITTGALNTPTPSFYFDGQNGSPPPGFNAYAEFSLVNGANFNLNSIDLKTNAFQHRVIVTSNTNGNTVDVGSPTSLTTIPLSGTAFTNITWFRVLNPGGFATQIDNVVLTQASASPPTQASRSSLPIVSKAVGWWAAENNVSDLFGQHNGQAHGPMGYAPGVVGNAMSFDGISSYIEIPDAADLNFTTQMSVEAWINPSGHVGQFDPVVKKGSAAQTGGFSLEFSGNTIVFWVYLQNIGWRSAVGTSIPNYQWTHVAGTYDGQRIHIYVNGQEIGTGTQVVGVIGSVSPSLSIAKDLSNAGRYYKGLIDEVTVYNAALNANEVLSIFNNGSFGKGSSSLRVLTSTPILAGLNTPLSASLTVAGGNQPYNWTLSEGRLPNGVTLGINGTLQGTPTEAGEFRFGTSVADSTNATVSDYATLRISIPEVPYPAPRGIVAWWPFEDAPTSGILADRVGNNTAAKANGPAATPGKVRQALHFNGVDQYLSIVNSATFNFGANDFSFETWARFDTPGGGSMGEPGHILIGSSNGPGLVNKWFFALGGGVLEFVVGDTAVAGSFYALGSFSPTVGQWYHLAVIKEGNTLKSFINGNSAGFATNVINIPITTAPVTIGQSEFIGFFNGAIDEPTVYGRALRPEEVQAIFNAGNAGKTAEMSIKPTKGGIGGLVTVHIEGIGFQQGATVQLIKTGQTNIIGSLVSVGLDGTAIDTTFNLDGAVNGPWNVVVSNPDANTYTLSNGFVLEQPTPAELWSDFAGLALYRPNRPQQFHLFYGNRGNTNVSDVIIWVAVPTNVSAISAGPYLTDIGPMPDDSPTPVNGYHYLWFYTDKLSAGETRSLTITLTTPSFGQQVIKNGIFEGKSALTALSGAPQSTVGTELAFSKAHNVLAAQPMSSHSQPENGDIVFKNSDPGELPTGHVGIFYVDQDGKEWVIDFVTTGHWKGIESYAYDGGIRKVAFSEWAPTTFAGANRPEGVTPSQAANAANAANQAYLVHIGEHPPYMIPPRATQSGSLPPADDCVSFVGDQYRSAGYQVPWSDWSSPGALYEFITKQTWPEPIYRTYKLLRNFYETLDYIGYLFEIGYESPQITITGIGSFDPNDQVGPKGVGDLRYLAGSEPLHYVISFENHDTATAPAQEVIVENILDPYKVDINSVQLGDIHVGAYLIKVPHGMQNFSHVLDLRPNQNLLVAIDSNLNPNTNTLSWHFRSLDPLTMQPPDNPLEGFLPPNLMPPGGEGSVSFSVAPRDSIATGTTITNVASITFDYNPPIDTPVWSNTFDSSNPTIQAQPLLPLQSGPAFQLQWGSADTGSGVDHVSVEVSTNGGPFATLLENSISASTTFVGQLGSTYLFRITAWDRVGHSTQTITSADGSLLSTKISGITAIGDQTTSINTTLFTIPLQIGDPLTSPDDLTFSWNSSNPQLIPNSSVTIAGSGSDRTLSIAPAIDQVGGTIITLVMTNGSGSTSSISFAVNVQGSVQQMWRQQYFGSAANSGLGADSADADGTGQTNLFKYIAGLNPINGSRFSVDLTTSPNLGQRDIVFAPIVPGRTYLVQFTTDFTNGNWNPLTAATQSDSGNTRTVTDTDATTTRKFYRVRISYP